jgi:hypothetical protein
MNDWDTLRHDIEDGTAKREAMAAVVSEGRTWSELDENQWKAALFCLGYPPDMPQPESGDALPETK